MKNICLIISLLDNKEEINPSVTCSIDNTPLLNRCIYNCRRSGFDRIYLITNCNHSRIIAKQEEALEILPFQPATLVDAMYESANNIFYDTGFFINPKFPLINSLDIRRSLDFFNSNKLDSCFSAADQSSTFLWKNNKPLNFSISNRNSNYIDTNNHVTLETEAFYIRSRDSILDHKNIYGGNTKPFILAYSKSISTKHKDLSEKIEIVNPSSTQDINRAEELINKNFI